MHIGEKVREYRRMRRLTLRQLGTAADVSASFLSQLENGRTDASVGTLRRLATALGVAVADLIETGEPAAHRVLRRADRPEAGLGSGARKFMLTRPPLRHLEVYSAEFEPGGSTGDDPYTHGDAQELVLVLRGRAQVHIGPEVHDLAEGDSVEYATSVPHRLVNPGPEPAEVLWIISPPTPEAEPAGG